MYDFERKVTELEGAIQGTPESTLLHGSTRDLLWRYASERF